jgi:hypothetical protein
VSVRTVDATSLPTAWKEAKSWLPSSSAPADAIAGTSSSGFTHQARAARSGEGRAPFQIR